MTEESGDTLDAGSEGVSRRTLLGGAGGSLVASVGVGPPRFDSLGRGRQRVVRQADAQGGDPSGGGVPSYPDDPFIVTQNGQQIVVPPDLGWGGWKPAEDDETALRTLLQFHPDVLDFAALARFEDGTLPVHTYIERELEVSDLTGLPGTAGWNPSLQLGEAAARSAYSPVMEANSWTYPDGEPLEHPLGILGETFEDRPATISYGEDYGIPSPFAPGTLDLLVTATVERFEQGFSGFFLDGVNFFYLRGLDYSVWATAAFRKHLESLPDDRLNQLGVGDPASFEIKQYLRERDLAPDSEFDPREDPVFREFLLFQHRGLKDFFEAYRERVLDGLPDGVEGDDVALWGNQYLGTLTTPEASTIYASDAFDVVNTEQTHPFFDYGYKILHSLGRFDKPVLAETELTAPPGNPDHPLAEFDPGQNYPALQRYMLGEGYAMGAVHRISLTGRAPADLTLNHWVRKDGTVPEELRSFVDFVWAHERFLTGVEPDNPVAVVWSLPDRIWRRYGRSIDRFHGGAGVSSFLGTAKLLREAQVPYDVLTFGHPDIWDDAEQRERLSTCDAVVLPSLLCLTDAQLDAVEAYLHEGGTILVSGPPPSRTESFEPRDDVASALDHENALRLEGDPGRRRQGGGSPDGSLVEALERGGVGSLTAEDDHQLGVNRLAQPDDSRLLVHVLNHDYSPETDSFATKSDVTLRVPEPDFPVGAARYYSPRETADLETTDRGEAVEVVIPELVEWGFVAVGPSTDAFRPDVSAGTAQQAVGRAREEVGQLRESGRGGIPESVVADVQLDAAEVALSYGAYGQAKAAAARAMDAVEAAAGARRRSTTAADAPGFSVQTALFGGAVAVAVRWLLGQVRARDP